MVQWYCPDCFAEVQEQATHCPRCGADFANPARAFEEQLIRALGHPLPDRRLLAAQVLGQRQAHRAVHSLVELVDQADDPYLVAEATLALARIGDPAGLAVVERMAREGPAVARAAASRALRERRPRPSGFQDGGRPEHRTTVFVIRHGRTALNADGALRGRVNVPLDEVGLAEAARLGELFVRVPLTAVVCSPLRRARQTAAPIGASTGARLLIDTAFTDRDVGGWSGVPAAQVEDRFGDLDRAPGVEPRVDFDRRVLAGWTAVTSELAGTTFAIVTHDAVIAYLLEVLLGEHGRSAPRPTGGWSRLERRDDRWSAAVLGAGPDADRPERSLA
jgi:broad specificity phosphatase PhoE